MKFNGFFFSLFCHPNSYMVLTRFDDKRLTVIVTSIKIDIVKAFALEINEDFNSKNGL